MSTALENLILVETHDDSDSDDSGAPILEPVTIEEQLALRAEKRANKAAEIHTKAEVFRRMGDELFERKKYEEALIPYLEASRIWPGNTQYFIYLAETYAKLQWFEESAHAATRALTLEPTSIEARYTRARARLEQRLPLAAKTDLETIVKYDSTHRHAKEALEELTKALDAAKDQHAIPVPSPQDIVDFSYPHYDESPIELDAISHSSDCHHRGNGVPCKFYNHGRCGKGRHCPYSHAPDEKSVRDDLGRNVCTYFLLDSCKFGQAKCVYSHSREFLPKRGWWTDAEKTAKIKGIVELAEKTAKEQRSLSKTLPKRNTSASSTLKAALPATPKTPSTRMPKPAAADRSKEKEEPEAKKEGEMVEQEKPVETKKKATKSKKKVKNPEVVKADSEKENGVKVVSEEGAVVEDKSEVSETKKPKTRKRYNNRNKRTPKVPNTPTSAPSQLTENAANPEKAKVDTVPPAAAN